MLIINDLQKSHNGVYTIQAVGKNLQPRAELRIESKLLNKILQEKNELISK